MRGVISPGGLWLSKPELMKPAPRLPSYVKLDMALGLGAGTTLFDKSRYRSHGAITRATWATGAHGKCLDFDPTEPSYVEIPATHTQLDFTSEDFSLIMRLYIDSLAIARFLFNRGVSESDGYSLFVLSNSRVFFRTNQLGPFQDTATVVDSLTTGTWYTLGISRSADSVRIYRNGIDITEAVGFHLHPATCARSALIGIMDDKSSYPFDGKVEFLRVFGGIALSASEHKAWHNALA